MLLIKKHADVTAVNVPLKDTILSPETQTQSSCLRVSIASTTHESCTAKCLDSARFSIILYFI